MRGTLQVMRTLAYLAATVATLALAAPSAGAAPATHDFKLPLAQKKLANGLTVVVSEDHAAPIFGYAVVYGVGFRLEPEGRSGFAHLFEHLMFEGTPVAGEGVYDRVNESGGGQNNGFTRHDHTTYIVRGPAAALDQMLWLEADRMKTLEFSQKTLDNQRNVVKEEVRVNVLDQPYGGFFSIDLFTKAFDRWPNAHNFYGDFKDLDEASVADVRDFFRKYYVPSNAVLVVVGDVSAPDVLAKVEKYFGAIPGGKPPARPDVTERVQEGERRFTQEEKFAPLPAIGVGYRMPPPASPEALVGLVAATVLLDGDASRLHQSLVKERKVATAVFGGVNNFLEDGFDYNGPTLVSAMILVAGDSTVDAALAAFDDTVARLAASGPTPEELARARSKLQSSWFDTLEDPMTRAATIGRTVLYRGSGERVNTVAADLAKIGAAEVQAFAKTFLVPRNRTIIVRAPRGGK